AASADRHAADVEAGGDVDQAGEGVAGHRADLAPGEPALNQPTQVDAGRHADRARGDRDGGVEPVLAQGVDDHDVAAVAVLHPSGTSAHPLDRLALALGVPGTVEVEGEEGIHGPGGLVVSVRDSVVV